MGTGPLFSDGIVAWSAIDHSSMSGLKVKNEVRSLLPLYAFKTYTGNFTVITNVSVTLDGRNESTNNFVYKPTIIK